MNKTIGKALEFLFNPEKAFKKETKTETSDAFFYAALLLIIYSVLFSVFTVVIKAETITSILFVATTSYILMIVSMILLSLWLHLWAYIFGARKGLSQTMKTVFYGSTPHYLLGWIPLFGIFSWIWCCYLIWTGLKRLHRLSGSNAAFAVIIPLLIPLVLVIIAMLFIAFLAASFMPMMPSVMQ